MIRCVLQATKMKDCGDFEIKHHYERNFANSQFLVLKTLRNNQSKRPIYVALCYGIY